MSSDIEGWTRPPRTPLETLIENERFGLNPYRDDAVDSLTMYVHNDLLTTRNYTNYYKKVNKNKIKKVIFNDPATIVIWGDDSKTVVKCDEDEFDPEKGLAMAIAKHFLGTNDSKGNYYNIFDKWLPKEEVEEITESTTETIRKVLGNAFDGMAFDFKLKETDSDETDNN